MAQRPGKLEEGHPGGPSTTRLMAGGCGEAPGRWQERKAQAAVAVSGEVWLPATPCRPPAGSYPKVPEIHGFGEHWLQLT